MKRRTAKGPTAAERRKSLDSFLPPGPDELLPAMPTAPQWWQIGYQKPVASPVDCQSLGQSTPAHDAGVRASLAETSPAEALAANISNPLHAALAAIRAGHELDPAVIASLVAEWFAEHRGGHLRLTEAGVDRLQRLNRINEAKPDSSSEFAT